MDSPDALDIDPSQLQLETIAEGVVSVVSRATVTCDDQKTRVIAVKSSTIHEDYVREPHDIVKELRLLASLSHPNIVSILGFKIDRKAENLRFWMPFVQYRLSDLLSTLNFSPHPLVSLMSSSGPTPKEQRFVVLAKSIIFQVICAVAYLHDSSRKIAHRDIKPANILLTETGYVKLVDFGISWREDDDEVCKEHDLWPEYPNKMYFEVSTGPYRAPELLFGPRTYDASAIDLWSLGTTFAEFFTSLRLSRVHGEFDDDDDIMRDPDPSPNDTITEKDPFIIPPDVRPSDPSARWSRDSLFDARVGEIGLAWSIFKTRGTPNETTWPTFLNLPDAQKVSFVDAPPVDLHNLFPNLPLFQKDEVTDTTTHAPPESASPTPLDLIHRLLVYPQDRRLRAAAALRHPWFAAQPPFLLPLDYQRDNIDETFHLIETSWEDNTLGDWVRLSVPLQREQG